MELNAIGKSMMKFLGISLITHRFNVFTIHIDLTVSTFGLSDRSFYDAGPTSEGLPSAKRMKPYHSVRY